MRPGTGKGHLKFVLAIIHLIHLASGDLILGTYEKDISQKFKNISVRIAGGYDETLVVSTMCGYHLLDFQIMLDSLENSLNFYDNNADKLQVFDAASGPQFLTAQLGAILQSQPTTLLPDWVQKHLKYLRKKAGSLNERIIQSAMNSPEYTDLHKKKLLPFVLTKGLWDWPQNDDAHSSVIWKPFSVMPTYFQPRHRVKPAEILTRNPQPLKDAFDRETDACLTQTFNCSSKKITESCENLFLYGKYSHYILTHQVLYTYFAEKNGCFLGNKSTLANLRKIFCRKVWLEANSISQVGFLPRLADLFVEQGKLMEVTYKVVFCGMAGYPNFFRRDWFLQLTSWQYPSGCFVDALRQSMVDAQNFPDISSEYRSFKRRENHRLHQPRHSHFRKRHHINVHRREKRADATIRQESYPDEVCSVHFTALGIMAMGLHLRYFVDTCLPVVNYDRSQ